MNASLLRISVAAFALILGACSTYQARWREAKKAPAPDKFAGAYEGTWTSAQYKDTGGKLWCILTKKSGSEYLAQFRATWHGVFASEHEVVLKVTGQEKREPFSVGGHHSPLPKSRPGTLAISQSAIDRLLFGNFPTPHLPKVRITKFAGTAEIHMWIGSGTYRCEGELHPESRGYFGYTGSGPILIPMPAKMTARYDATYDKGTLSLTKAAP